jgi:5-methylcytosine-specific restriction endonuclease McrA
MGRIGSTKSRKIKPYLLERQKGFCYYCAERITVRSSTLDHYLPRAILIPEVIAFLIDPVTRRNTNLVLACPDCNHEKADTLPEEWNKRLGPYLFIFNGWQWVGA